MTHQPSSLTSPEQFDAWDPLEASAGADPGIVISAQKREISNILKSYTGYYDLFSELIQNGLDAIERRFKEGNEHYTGKLFIKIDLNSKSVSITDNGCGMNLEQFQQLLRPNFSFKTGEDTRGCKGVGATYLGYGFNHLEIATKCNEKIYSGVLENGRLWVEDRTGIIPRPKIKPSAPSHEKFMSIDRGTSMTVKLVGNNIRPKNLSWLMATSASQWLVILRAVTPVGGIYIASNSPDISISIEVVSADGSKTTEESVDKPRYLYPHDVLQRSADLRDFIADQQRRIAKGGDPSKIPAKFLKLNGIWGEWNCDQIFGDKGVCPIQPKLTESEKKLARTIGISIYVYLAFSTELWDSYNDNTAKFRQGARLLRGGLQLSTRNMPQGMTLTIPMTNNVGFQNLAHVVIHFDQAEPDLGRKGFQPEHVKLAEKIAVSAVTAFRHRYNLLRKPGVANIYGDQLRIQDWIRDQEEHEKSHGLVIKGTGLFLPTEELPIRSEPRVEQDVVALFNQMLSSGLVRGVQLIASSQYNQYDGLYRIFMEKPYDKFILSEHNPLGVDAEIFGENECLKTPIKVLEYKYNLDGLVEELQADVKSAGDIGLVVAWECGKKWKEMFDVTSLLDPDNVHHRKVHGTTHSFTHSVSGSYAFEAIILHDLIRFLTDKDSEVARQRSVFCLEE